MGRRLNSKYKIDRRMGENIWGRPKSPVNRRAYGPGEQGQKRRGKLSDFGLQLRAKQKLKGYYGNITEKQFRSIYRKAEQMRGDTSENLIGLLECRLDAIVYRSKFASTVFAARQMINHGHIVLNDVRNNIPSTQLRPGDKITLGKKMHDAIIVVDSLNSEEREMPDYIEVDPKKMTATFKAIPSFEDTPYPVRMEPNLVVEYYSKN